MKPSVLVTGASSGIGAATAAHLLSEGFRVVGTSRRPAAAAARAPDVRWLAMDVCDEKSVADGVARVLEESGRLEGVVCNAGMGIFGSVEEVSLEAARAQFDTNFFGTLRVLRAALPSMREAGRGRIVVVGSLAGRAPMPFRAHYSASKAALDALVQALRSELHPFGVGVSLVEPGDVDTPFEADTDWSLERSSVYGDRPGRAAKVMRDSLPRAPGPEIVARAVHRALTARRPRIRYPVGPDSRILPLARRLLPERLVLALVRRHFGV